jgi:hypothetical protein
VNSGANRNISGYIYRGTSMDYDFVKDAIVYAKSDGYYKDTPFP